MCTGLPNFCTHTAALLYGILDKNTLLLPVCTMYACEQLSHDKLIKHFHPNIQDFRSLITAHLEIMEM